MAVEMRRHTWTVEDYDRMIAAGVFADDDRVELIEGEIVEMSPIGIRHTRAVNRLTALLVPPAAGRAIVQIQGPLHLSDRSEPQPDVALLRWREDFYLTHATPTDVLVLIEVADSSLEFDRRVKFPAYATAGIAEAWLVDLDAATIEVHTSPVPGGYQQVRMATPGQSIAVRGLAGLDADVGDLLR